MIYPHLRRLGRRLDEARERANWWLWATMFFVNRELKHHPGLPLRTRLWALRQGFYSESVPLFGLREDDPDRYLSNWDRLRTRSINGEAGHVHRNKAIFYYLLAPKWGDSLPRCFGVLRGGRTVSLPACDVDPGSLARTVVEGDSVTGAGEESTTGREDESATGREAGGIDPDRTDAASDGGAVGAAGDDRGDPTGGRSLRACVDDAGTVVVRPVDGSGGEDVSVVSAETEGYSIDGVSVDADAIDRFASHREGNLVTAFVEQGPFPRSLYPHTPNTLRIVTMIDPDANEPFVAAAVQRIGTSESVPVDNWSRGGIAANVDLDDGTLSAAVSYPEGNRRGEHSTHPETGAAIAGEQVPAWDAIREEVLSMAAYVGPITPYVGWDVLVTDDEGSFAVVEGNNWPDIDVVQPHVPMATGRPRRFYEHHGIL